MPLSLQQELLFYNGAHQTEDELQNKAEIMNCQALVTKYTLV